MQTVPWSEVLIEWEKNFIRQCVNHVSLLSDFNRLEVVCFWFFSNSEINLFARDLPLLCWSRNLFFRTRSHRSMNSPFRVSTVAYSHIKRWCWCSSGETSASALEMIKQSWSDLRLCSDRSIRSWFVDPWLCPNAHLVLVDSRLRRN